MPSTPTILIATPTIQEGQSLASHIADEFRCNIQKATSEEELHLGLRKHNADILLVDTIFDTGEKGLALIGKIKQNFPDLLILPLVPASQRGLVQQVLALDVFFYINTPIEPIETTLTIKRAIESFSLQQARTPIIPSEDYSEFHGMIGSTASMQKLFDLISRVAEDDLSTVLIRGESGTGKEMVAKAIHAQSVRAKRNFVPVNCAAIPDDLLESELFGYTKGAFTGANTNKPGRIQYADGGTLFLDEIGDMKSSLQAKLLRVLQEKEFEPVGSLKPTPVNTRVLAATHCDLEQLVNEGKFREDLYYRLSVIPLNIPPLKERKEDIPLLINSFIESYTEKRNREPFTFSPQALIALINFEWRGNVRELENLIQHMSILYSGKQVEFSDLPEKFLDMQEFTETHPDFLACFLSTTPDPAVQSELPPALDTVNWQEGQVDFKELINDFETQLIVQAMKLTAGNKKEAAKLLNLKRTTLLEKIKKKDLNNLWSD